MQESGLTLQHFILKRLESRNASPAQADESVRREADSAA
jgi:hypothetical protein